MVSATIRPARKAPITAARPTSAAIAARAEAKDHRRQQRRLGEPGRLQEPGPCLGQSHAAERDEGDEADRESERERDRGEVNAALGGDSDRNGDQHQGEDVVDHRRAEDRAGRPAAQHAAARASTAEVIPTLVAASAAPRKIDDSLLSPRASPVAIPAANGTTTPLIPVSAATRPTSRIS